MKKKAIIFLLCSNIVNCYYKIKILHDVILRRYIGNDGIRERECKYIDLIFAREKSIT